MVWILNSWSESILGLNVIVLFSGSEFEVPSIWKEFWSARSPFAENPSAPPPPLGSRRHTRHELRKLQEVAAVQRQRENLLCVDHGAQGCVVALDQRRLAGDLDGLRDLADFERDVEPCILVDLQGDRLELGAAEA